MKLKWSAIMSGRNRKNLLSAAILFVFFSAMPCVLAHIVKARLIIDTDMALDDIRAVSMILGNGGYDVAGIICSEGSASVETGYRNMKKMLSFFGRADIEVISGKEKRTEAPAWRGIAEGIEIPGGDESGGRPVSPFNAAALAKKINAVSGKVTYLCLGPLTNLAAVLRFDPKAGDKIERIIFYGSAPDSAQKDFNCSFDSASADFVYSSGIPMTIVDLSAAKPIVLDGNIIRKLENSSSDAARLILASHSSETVKALINEKHLKLWDDIAAMYLIKPSLFKQTGTAKKNIILVKDYNETNVLNSYLEMLGKNQDSALQPRKAVILKEFPVQPNLFTDDLKPYIKEIIQKYGKEEWIACFLTNELHRHLGGYSIIGAKMGIRAREILNAPFDELSVISFAGIEPPLSCMNDGLQVSTGASLGRGTITVAEGKNEPSAEFRHRNKTVRLTIKKEIIERISRDIKATSEKYGWLTKAYYENLRTVAIRYWLELDRKAIFIEE
jgi:pyrimidine-specific ribonucleoside hydrolase